ncbi:MAG: CpaF family protein [Rickettsiales bacterium]
MFGKRPTGAPPPPGQPDEGAAPSTLPAVVSPQGPTGSQLPVAATSSPHNLQARQNFDVLKKASVNRSQLATTATAIYTDPKLETPDYREAKAKLIEKLINDIDFISLQKLSEHNRRVKIREAAGRALEQIGVPITAAQIELLKDQAFDEIVGLGPLEPLLADPDINDIMINTANRVYVEKQGKVYLSDIKFLNERHLLGIIQRVVSKVGRRIDESSPMVDARLSDGSRFNAIIPPLALDGALVSIRKFKKTKMTLQEYTEIGSLSPAMAKFLEIAGNIRLNIIISGGTGSGKTTLLNAISGHIEPTERVITIEDAAELQLMQPHVLRLETRPASTEGTGEITQRQLVKNALRMRPDRIILGEMRGEEVIDVLSAMNTGHDGSLATIHSNSPRDCLSRIENLVNMSGVSIPVSSLRYQISSAVQLIVQLSRMRDGRRRITQIEEIVGMEGDIITTQTLFSYKAQGLDQNGNLLGEYLCHGIRPRFLPQAEYFGRERELMECLNIKAKF